MAWLGTGLAGLLMAILGVAGLPGANADEPVNGLDPLLEFESYPPAIKGKRCVVPVDIIRRRHMEFLDLQKDRAMVRGQRNQRFSLQQCVDCHAGPGPESVQDGEQGQPQRIDAPGQFCAGCHEYVGIRIDCFSCHAATPRKDGKGEADQRLSARAFSGRAGLTNPHFAGVSGD